MDFIPKVTVRVGFQLSMQRETVRKERLKLMNVPTIYPRQYSCSAALVQYRY